MKVRRMEIDELHNLHIMLSEGYIPLRTWFILLTKTVDSSPGCDTEQKYPEHQY